MNNELQILVGVPGSGKSTYANQLIKQNSSYVKISRDDFRFMLKNDWYPGEDIENLVSALVDQSVKKALEKGWDVVLDNTHCNSKTLKDTIRKFGKDARIVIKIIGAELSMKQIKEQNAKRDKAVPETVIDRMYKGFTAIVKNKKEFQDLVDDIASTAAVEATSTFKQNELLPKAILVDIDGTVAHMNEWRGPFEWHKVDLDDPDFNVIDVVRALSKTYKIVFMSGRDESCREKTIQWLNTYYLPSEIELYMRPANNFQKDNIVKRALFDKHIKDKYYIEAVLDDRDQVVKMWREELGLKCLQVAYGSF